MPRVYDTSMSGPEHVDALKALRNRMRHCRECPLGEPATQTVPGEGEPAARLMLVGEIPGDH